MKKTALLFIFILLCILQLTAQRFEKYFDYKWDPCEPSAARYLAMIEKTDSGWFRLDYFATEKTLQMRGLYADSGCTIKNGYFTFYHANGILSSIGRYKDNKKEATWISFYSNRYMRDSTVYENGEPTGISLQWHNDGSLSDSANYKEDGSAVAVSWFDNGNVSAAGRLMNNKKTGKWQFFHQNSKLSASEIYDKGKLIDRKYFTEDGTPLSDTTDKTHPAVFPGGIPAWMKYLEQKLYFPAGYQFVGDGKAALTLEFTVDVTGEVIDVNLITPFHPALNDIALRTFRNSPKWIPAIDHNRKIKYRHQQTVTFKQTSY